MNIIIDSRETVILAILVLFLGKYLTRKIKFLSKYNIPEPVSGGIIASLLFASIYFIFNVTVNFDLSERDALLVVFFTCIGLSSQFSTLLQGGKPLVILLVLAVAYLFIQNFTGIGVAYITGIGLYEGLVGGSVSLSGGHGTAIAWAPTFIQEYGVSNAMEIGIACATFGLVLGGIAGGPIAHYLINKHNLKSTHTNESLSVGISHPEEEKIHVDDLYSFVLILSIAIGVGLYLNELLISLGVTLPLFVSCLFGGILLTNTVPLLWKKVKWPTGKPMLALISDYSLGMFLTMSLMSLQLWTLIDLALPIIALLVAQVVVVALFTIFIVFRVLGKTYDAAIMSSGYIGLALGATPTAIANMTAVTKKFGASPQAFIIVPLIGAFFIDISNAVIIKVMIGLIG
jgi:ESS family glutamate:Na+ symporter